MRTRLAAAVALTLALAGCADPVTAPAGPSPQARSAAPALPPGDGAPHPENNAWKVRAELSDAERAEAEAAAEKIRPALETVRAAGDFGYLSVRSALMSLGYTAEQVVVNGMNDPSVPGAVYAVRIGARGCVLGTVEPARVTAEVKGAGKEFGCIEPYTH